MTSLMRGSWAALLALALPSIALAEDPEWLRELRAREGAVLPVVDVASSDGAMTARVPAKLVEKIKLDQGAYSLLLDIGAEAPVSCELIKEGFDAGALLRGTLDATLKDLNRLQGKIEAHAVERLDAGAMDDSPFIAADWVYRVNDGKQPLLGVIKQFVALKAGHGIYCSHVEVGYSKTFRSVVQAFVESVQIARDDEPAQFVEIHTVQVGDSRVGFVRTRVHEDKDGDYVVSTLLSTVMPNEKGGIDTDDTYDTQWVRPDGALINGRFVSARNGDIDVLLDIRQHKDGGWEVAGKIKGKDFEQKLEGEGEPGTLISQVNARAKALAATDPAGRQAEGAIWLSIDPGKINRWSFKVGDAAGPGEFDAVETVAGLAMNVRAEAGTGLLNRLVMKMGPQSIEYERAFIRGRL